VDQVAPTPDGADGKRAAEESHGAAGVPASIQILGQNRLRLRLREDPDKAKVDKLIFAESLP
jgi:hypothetical protein